MCKPFSGQRQKQKKKGLVKVLDFLPRTLLPVEGYVENFSVLSQGKSLGTVGTRSPQLASLFTLFELNLEHPVLKTSSTKTAMGTTELAASR